MAFSDEVEAIRAMPDKLDAFRAATKLMELQLEFRHMITDLRADLAHEIREEGDLSIGKLAEQLGVSRGQAHPQSGSPPRLAR